MKRLSMVDRIAIFRALYLGDMLCIIPTIRAVRMAYPHAEIFLIGLPWQAEFVSRFPEYFDAFIEFPGWPGLPEQPFNPDSIIAFLERMNKYRFDLLLQAQGNGVITNTLCMLWGARKVCGLRRQGEYCPDEKLFPVSEDGEHEILRFLKLADALSIPRHGTQLEFPVSASEQDTFIRIAETTDLTGHEYVCIHPGARDVRRRWPVDKFAAIANEIATHGYPVVLTGSMEEKHLLRQLQAMIKGRVVNIVETFGHLTAGELACLLQHSRLLVSNDTGVSHIASALHVQSVILFSPYSDMKRWRPLDEETHTSIPYDKTVDCGYVLQRVMRKLEAQTPERTRGVSRF